MHFYFRRWRIDIYYNSGGFVWSPLIQKWLGGYLIITRLLNILHYYLLISIFPLKVTIPYPEILFYLTVNTLHNLDLLGFLHHSKCIVFVIDFVRKSTNICCREDTCFSFFNKISRNLMHEGDMEIVENIWSMYINHTK